MQLKDKPALTRWCTHLQETLLCLNLRLPRSHEDPNDVGCGDRSLARASACLPSPCFMCGERIAREPVHLLGLGGGFGTQLYH